MKRRKAKDAKRDLKSRIIKKQFEEIQSLKKAVSDLEIECKEKDEVIGSIDDLRVKFMLAVNDLRLQREKYDELISELKKMKKVMSRECFRGRWRIVKWIIR